jgi:GAF domain-containing protein
VDDHGLRHVYRSLATGDGGPFNRLTVICHACVDVLGVAGAGVMLMAERAHQGTIYATDPTIQTLEELQNVAAEGPCIDAYTLGRPVLEPDLAGAGVRVWPLLAPGAMRAGMRALFSFPLALDDTCLGALNLYRGQPGHLTVDELHDARLMAAMAAREILALQADAAPGTLPPQIADLSGDRMGIEQATGMVAAQLDVSVVDAARRLRQIAAAQGRHLADVASDVITRQLRVEKPPPAE